MSAGLARSPLPDLRTDMAAPAGLEKGIGAQERLHRMRCYWRKKAARQPAKPLLRRLAVRILHPMPTLDGAGCMRGGCAQDDAGFGWGERPSNEVRYGSEKQAASVGLEDACARPASHAQCLLGRQAGCTSSCPHPAVKNHCLRLECLQTINTRAPSSRTGRALCQSGSQSRGTWYRGRATK
jgi:hypothetical protein